MSEPQQHLPGLFLSFEQQPEVLPLSGLVTADPGDLGWGVATGKPPPGLGLPRAGVM